MKAKLRSKLIGLLLFVCCMFLTLSFAITGLTHVKAATVGVDDFVMVNGASIRYSNPTGMRFKALMGENVYNEVENDENKSFGILIVPKIIMENYSIPTTYSAEVDYLTLLQNSYSGTLLTMEAKAYYDTEDEAYAVRGSIAEIKEQNYGLEFFGIAYIKTEGETPTYKYASFTDGENVRKPAEVAESAYVKNDHNNDETKAGILKEMIAKGVVEESENVAYDDMESISLIAKDNANENAIKSVTLKANVSEELTSELVWASSNNEVATVENGVVSSGVKGNAIITAKLFGKTVLSRRINVVDKVKVVLLSGQSNAVGISYLANLKNNINEEEYAKYEKGFENVKIKYWADGNQSNDFVNVKLGQGSNTGCFGSEIGIAKYFAESYPDELVYIIKYAAGGTRLYDQWSSPSSGDMMGQLYTNFLSEIDDGLALLDGLNPEINALIWIQGESDCALYQDVYLSKLSNFVDDIRDTYADYSAPNGISFIDVGVSANWSNYANMNAIKQDYADSSNINYFISVDDISYDKEGNPASGKIDTAHYDSVAMITLGSRIGATLKDVLTEDVKEVTEDYKEQFNSDVILVQNRFTSETPYIYESTNYYAKSFQAVAEDNYVYVKFVTEYQSNQTNYRSISIDLDNDDSAVPNENNIFLYFNVENGKFVLNQGIGKIDAETGTYYKTIGTSFSLAPNGVSCYYDVTKLANGVDMEVYFKIDVTKFGLTEVSEDISTFYIGEGRLWNEENRPGEYINARLNDNNEYQVFAEKYNGVMYDDALSFYTALFDGVAITPFTANTSYNEFAVVENGEYLYFKTTRNSTNNINTSASISINDKVIILTEKGDRSTLAIFEFGTSNATSTELLSERLYTHVAGFAVDTVNNISYVRVHKGVLAETVGAFTTDTIKLWDVNAGWDNRTNPYAYMTLYNSNGVFYAEGTAGAMDYFLDRANAYNGGSNTHYAIAQDSKKLYIRYIVKATATATNHILLCIEDVFINFRNNPTGGLGIDFGTAAAAEDAMVWAAGATIKNYEISGDYIIYNVGLDKAFLATKKSIDDYSVVYVHKDAKIASYPAFDRNIANYRKFTANSDNYFYCGDTDIDALLDTATEYKYETGATWRTSYKVAQDSNYVYLRMVLPKSVPVRQDHVIKIDGQYVYYTQNATAGSSAINYVDATGKAQTSYEMGKCFNYYVMSDGYIYLTVALEKARVTEWCNGADDFSTVGVYIGTTINVTAIQNDADYQILTLQANNTYSK